MSRRLGVVALVALVLGCSEEFNPVVEGDRPYVVFGLLSTASEVQVIRVHDTASPTDPAPGNPLVPGAVVSITGPAGTMALRDTLLTPPSGSADTTSIGAYVAAPFVPERGQPYTLLVQSDKGNAQATITVPGTGDMHTSDFLVLRSPYAYDESRGIVVQALLSSVAYGYVIRLVLEYERLVGSTWVLERFEVPLGYQEIDDLYSFTADYPFLTRRETANISGSNSVRGRDGATFSNQAYRQTLSILYLRYGKTQLNMKRALFILTQADEHFFTYYSFANFFQDQYTIRVDQPDYSNMQGALGFFGSMTNDTLAYLLPSNLAPPDLP